MYRNNGYTSMKEWNQSHVYHPVSLHVLCTCTYIHVHTLPQRKENVVGSSWELQPFLDLKRVPPWSYIQQWALLWSPYDYQMQFKSANGNTDSLSRLPIQPTVNSHPLSSVSHPELHENFLMYMSSIFRPPQSIRGSGKVNWFSWHFHFWIAHHRF